MRGRAGEVARRAERGLPLGAAGALRLVEPQQPGVPPPVAREERRVELPPRARERLMGREQPKMRSMDTD